MTTGLVVPLIWFLGASAAVVGAGILLSYAADAIADRTGLGRLTIGVVLLAAATSLPEIIVGISGARLNAPDLAVGDMMGSCIMNMLILAIADLLYHMRSHVTIMPRLVLGHAHLATLSMVLVGIAGVGIVAHEPFSAFGLGGSTVLIVLIYVLEMRAGVKGGATDVTEAVVTPVTARPPMALRAALLWFALGAAVIGLAGPVLTRTADHLATVTGLGQTFFGSVFLALVTSLPELAASLAALRLGAIDLTIGNLFGSNCFNMAALFAFDLADGKGPLLAAVEMRQALTALITLVVTCLALQIVITRQLRRTWYIEPAAIVLVMASLLGVLVLYLTP
jgi:cation:H+ antiporter